MPIPVLHAIRRQQTPAEAELTRRRDELRALRATLADREQTLAHLRDRLMSFEGRYLRQVGTLYRQLDEWEERIAELHAKHDPAPPSAAPAHEEAPAAPPGAVPSLDLRALFRELAKRIHPDFAADAQDSHRRTRLMAQANDAYLREDATVLQRMLNGFDAPDHLSRANAVEAELAAVAGKIQLVRHDIATAEADTEALRASESALLEKRVLEAARCGRDLLAEMAARVKGSIGIAMRRYDVDLHRINHPPTTASAGCIEVDSLLSAATPTRRRFGKR